MSDGQGGAPADNGSSANVVYILYLVALVTSGVTAIVGLVIAYVYRANAPTWVQSHYEVQTRTFWIALLAAVAGSAMVWAFVMALDSGILYLLMLIAVLAYLFFFVWWIVRCVKGMRYLSRREAYPNPETWLW
jgi:uncharacterized membrane protein